MFTNIIFQKCYNLLIQLIKISISNIMLFCNFININMFSKTDFCYTVVIRSQNYNFYYIGYYKFEIIIY